MIAAKFLDQKPTYEMVLEATSKNPKVQLVLSTKGIYDLLIFCLAENNDMVVNILNEIRDSETLKYVKSEWYVTSIHSEYGFLPLRQEFFDILKDKLTNNSISKDNLSTHNLKFKEYALLYELNINSRREFKSLDQKYNLPIGSSKKAYNDMIDKGKENIILRPTIIIKNASKKYDAILVAKIIDRAEFIKSKRNLLKYKTYESGSFIDSFSYICDMEIPDSILYLFPVINEDSLEKVKTDFFDMIKGIELESQVVEKIIVGNLGYRSFDDSYLPQYSK